MKIIEGFTGGCQCGAIRFRANAPLGKASICHCRMCQKAFGNWGAALVSVPFDQFSWTRGSPSEFRSSAIVARGFCKDCGTPLYMHEDGFNDIEMAIGAFDDPNAVGPLVHQVGVESRVAWFNGMRDLPGKTTEEDRTPEDILRLKSLQHPDHD
jgi:hypothetical protein